MPQATNREIQPLITNGPVEVEKQLVQVQDFRQNASRRRGIYKAFLRKRRKTETLRYQHGTGWTWKHLNLVTNEREEPS